MRTHLILPSLAMAVLFMTISFPAHGENADLSALAKKDSYRQKELAEKNDCFEVHVSYPVFDRPALDQSVQAWAERFFAEEVAEFKRECPQSRAPERPLWEVQGGVGGVSATRGTVSLDFGFYSDTGGAHPAHFTRTVILNAQGRRLEYTDLFSKTEGLWQGLSDFCFKALEPEMLKRDCWNQDTVRDGLTPAAESFQYVLVTPSGLNLIFPEYQVAPYVCGAFNCEVPLQALARFAPKPGIWDEAAVSAAAAAAPAAPAGSFSPSFNCAKASTAVELAICADPLLSEMDVRLAAGYKKALGATTNKKALVAEQKQWLRQMHAQCSEKADSLCIQTHYTKRIEQLKGY